MVDRITKYEERFDKIYVYRKTEVKNVLYRLSSVGFRRI